MAQWPTGSVPKDHIDRPSDDPTQWRTDLNTLVDKVNAMIVAFAQANGVCDLDAHGNVPAARLALALRVANDLNDLDDKETALSNLGATAVGKNLFKAGSVTDVLQILFGDSHSVFPSGTRMLFQQTNAPTGWTKVATHNNKALRVVNGNVGSGGNTAFTTVFGNGKTTGSHTLTTSEVPSHTHFVARNEGGSNSTDVTATNYVRKHYKLSSYSPNYVLRGSSHVANIGLTNAVGGGGGHTHTLTMNLQYVDIIIATKD